MSVDYSTDDVPKLVLERRGLVQRMRALSDKIAKEKRTLTPDEESDFQDWSAQCDRLAAAIAEDRGNPFAEDIGPPPDGAPTSAEYRVLSPEDSIRSALGHPQHPELSLGKLIRGMSIGKWTDAEREKRAVQLEGVDTQGGFTVPSSMTSYILDMARARSVCFRAGARTVVMDDSETKVPRVTGDLTSYWVPEGATITESNATFGAYTIVPKTLACIGYASIELLQDSRNFGAVLENSMAQSLALALDLAGLRGTGAGEEPKGIAHSGVTDTAIGGAVTLDNLSDAVTRVRQDNHEPNAAIFNPRTLGAVEKIKNGDGVYMKGAPSWEALAKYSTTQIPITLGGGTATEIYVGDFSRLVFFPRMQLRIETFRSGGYAHGRDAVAQKLVIFRAMLRADWLVEYPEAFELLSGVTN
jgi:HK97 family phage major capsid protein